MSFSPHIIASLGMPEVVVIFIIALLLFGGKEMPKLARTLGRVMREFKKASSEIEREIKSAIDEDPLPKKKNKILPPPKESDPTEQEDYYDESTYPELEENYEDLNQPPDVSALPSSENGNETTGADVPAGTETPSSKETAESPDISPSPSQDNEIPHPKTQEPSQQ